ncbi:MAG: VWA domain-containing protein [Vicinamibacterales bacterium]
MTQIAQVGLVRRAALAAVVAGLSLAGVGARAQEPRPAPAEPRQQEPPPGQGGEAQQPTPIFRAGVELVRVDVSVQDGKGNPIPDLTASDFEVEEDGVPQEVVTADFVKLTGERTSELSESMEIRSAEHAALEAQRDDVRIFAIFLDDYHIEKAPRITIPLRESLVKFVDQFGPNDLVTVMDPLTPLDALEWTRSRSELEARMRSFEGRKGELFPVRSVLEEAQLRGNTTRLRAEVTLSALEALATHLGGLREGRKSILFVSEGPPVGQPGSPLDAQLERVIEAANRGNVTIHVLDPRPLGMAPMGGNQSTFRLTHETGGRAIVNTNSPDQNLAGVIADASAYYLVGYSPARNMADGKYHKIDVKVKRRGARVTSRQGYWAPSSTEMEAAALAASKPEVPGLADALEAIKAPPSGALADVWVGSALGTDGRTAVTVSWEPADPPPDRDATPPATLEVEPLVAGKDTALADPKDIPRGEGTSRPPAAATFDLAPGEIELRFTVKGPKGETLDRWAQPATIPDLSGEVLSLATPQFFRARSPYEFRQLREHKATTPVAARNFVRTDRVLVDLQAYGEGAAGATLTAELLNEGGDKLAELEMPPAEDGHARLELPLRNLAPALYVIRVHATAGEQTAERLEAFRVAGQ